MGRKMQDLFTVGSSPGPSSANSVQVALPQPTPLNNIKDIHAALGRLSAFAHQPWKRCGSARQAISSVAQPQQRHMRPGSRCSTPAGRTCLRYAQRVYRAGCRPACTTSTKYQAPRGPFAIAPFSSPLGTVDRGRGERWDGKDSPNRTFARIISAAHQLRKDERMALRETTGFVESLLRLTGLGWAVPDSSTICRRQRTLAVNIPYRGGNGPLHLLIPSRDITA